MRIILYTGKGGVGKTSVAAATALNLSTRGQKVFIMSTDQAHSLSDSFEQSISGEVTNIIHNLDALEIDSVLENEAAWGNLHSYLKELLTAKAEGGLETEELLSIPGLDELFSLFRILDIYEKQEYDTLIVDCAPTGETLNLLKFPEMFGNFIKRVLPFKRKAAKFAGPMVQKLTTIPMPKDDVFSDIEHLTDKLERLQHLMLDKSIVSIRIVTTPEKIVIQEAKRNFTYLHLFDYNVDAVIVNKVYPDQALEGYFHQWITLQKEGLSEIAESFADVPIFRLPLLSQELKTIPLLSQVGTQLYDLHDPSAIFACKKIFQLVTDGTDTILQIQLPFAAKEEMNLWEQQGELHLCIKNEKRCFLLPKELNGKEIRSAKLEQGVLSICFL